ncbi:copper-binding protein [Rhodanobacter thiooxydans]|uniref:copper-binding protein n=1 Tax=Rhodanobacter thiooxydans TaxID=416169 RepID=UPI000AC13544|nr:copper-binding protein [Rhodanobacter thiooxydans]
MPGMQACNRPTMPMTCKVNPSALLATVEVGEKVRFILHLASMASTVTAIAPLQPWTGRAVAQHGPGL